MLAKNLRYLRTKNNMEQIELAHKLGRKSSSSVSEWEKGKYTPKIGVLNDIAEIFGVSIYDLVNTDLANVSNSPSSILLDSFNKLDENRQKKVINFTKKQLTEQETVIRFQPNKEEIDTLAAHSKNPNKEYTPEEIDGIKAYLDELSEEYDRKHR
ncbi:helix-turn-helix transcriptional regulator [Enterococcus avium]|uniref:helix-turn-helix transcriptional regulator n=1 Tax=Enterococcus avium TaxID=33945 RepID=UPI00288DCCB4|nr:helix-turn-helix transcriptional regulator [Enterococcus avium]MDT2392751.1 helix-turn-helix transcriptional regulator [Enterococcus avium]MDT2416613.1 helix-turn-helix transcriptional regulator [Enterococcus avium]MDT2429853.1 helix-turn-helix transcriptional regulator [Enterococcus avium]MDT2438931.1 helix-turn-helix transcriptional regulator [Enterococcus avium]MDT2451959.1 helix-turn-helix transcriptional regulator [Enterococcus avium]